MLDVRRRWHARPSSSRDRSTSPIHEILQRLDEGPRGQVWVHCAAGYRAAIVASLLDACRHDVVAIDDAFGNARAAGFPMAHG